VALSVVFLMIKGMVDYQSSAVGHRNKWSSSSPRNAKGHLCNSRKSEKILRGFGGFKSWIYYSRVGIAAFVISKSDFKVKSHNIFTVNIKRHDSHIISRLHPQWSNGASLFIYF